MKTKKYQLKNGLRVLLLESQKSPVVSIQMWVKTGSADEKKGEEGLSHFIEHLVFKGTRKYKVGEIAQIVEGSGGELNAYTSFDQTVFYVTVTKEFADVGLDVIAEMMGHPTFDETEIDNEREVVIEEIKMGQDNPDRSASQALFQTVYKKHPYGIPVIGFDKNIRKVSTRKIADYFHGRYVPKNMFLVISGDFQISQMMKKVEPLFGKMLARPLKKASRKKEPSQTQFRWKVKKSDFKKSILYLAWKAPSVKHRDVPALDVLSIILGQGDSSRLAQKLRLDQPLVNAVSASAFTPQDPGFFAVTMHLEGSHLQEALTATVSEIQKIITTPPSVEEMQKAINNLASEQIYSVETVDGIARKAGSLEFYTGDYDYFKKYLQQIYQLKPIDIQKVAKKYLVSTQLSAMLQTDSDIKAGEKMLKDFAKALTKKISSEKIKTEKNVKMKPLKMSTSQKITQTGTQSWKHPSGLSVVYRRQSETPTVSVRLGFFAGSRLDPLGFEGRTELLTRSWVSGSKKYTEEEINHLVESKAAGISAFGGRNTLGMTADFLSNFTWDILPLVVDLIQSPLFPEDKVQREKEVLKRQIRSRMDHPSAVCMLQFQEAIFKSHPYSRDMLGTEESIAKIDHRVLQKAYQGLLSTQNLTLSVVGDIEKQDVEKFVNQLAQSLPATPFSQPHFKLDPFTKPLFTKYTMDKEQSHIIVGHRGMSLYDKDRYSLHLIQSILAGQGGRLFVELRDKNSLAYSVSPIRMEGLDCGYFGAYIGCSPEKSLKAISMINTEFEKLTQKLVSEDELLRAQKYLIGRHNIDLQRKSSISQSLLLDSMYGIDLNETFEVSKHYFAVTREDIQRVAQRIFSTPAVTCYVGPLIDSIKASNSVST